MRILDCVSWVALVAASVACSAPQVVARSTPEAAPVADAASPPPAADASPPPAADTSTPPVADASAPVAAVVPAAAGVRTYLGRAEDDWLREMATRPVVRVMERFHSTLFVFRLDLGDGIEVSFQPERPGQESFWKREVTSYHLARLLGIDNRVPPTVGRRVPLSVFGRWARGVNLVSDRRGMVLGSASAWVPVLERAEMHRGPGRQEWVRWMNPANVIPEASRERARQVTEVLVFDYLAANYDRWNCCNIAVDEHNNLVFRDNDAGWAPNVINNIMSPDVIRRVPRYLYESIQRVTAADIRASLQSDPMAREMPLVSSSVWEGYEGRRQALLANLRRAIARHGEAAVIAWP